MKVKKVIQAIIIISDALDFLNCSLSKTLRRLNRALKFVQIPWKLNI